MPPALDLRGRAFGRLTALQRSTNPTERKGVFWDCKCSCGAEVQVVSGALVSGNTSSCGCMHSENLTVRNFKHGLINTTDNKEINMQKVIRDGLVAVLYSHGYGADWSIEEKYNYKEEDYGN